MTGPKFERREGVIQKGANSVITARGDIAGQLTAMRGEVQSLAGSWTGMASTSFQQTAARWDQDATRMLNALDALAESLGEAEKAYVATDDSAAALFARAEQV